MKPNYYLGDGPAKLIYTLAFNLSLNGYNVTILAAGRKRYLYYKIQNLLNHVRINIVYINPYLKSSTSVPDTIIEKSISYYSRLSTNKCIKSNITNEVRNINSSMIESLEGVFDKTKDAIFIMWNNVTFLNNILFNLYGKEGNNKICIMENGLIRPNSVIIDYKGLNIDSSVCDLFESVNQVKDVTQKSLMINDSIHTIRYYYMHLLLGYDMTIFERLNFSWLDSLKMWVSKIKINNTVQSFEFEYIFAPLQIDDDSQSVFYSNGLDTISFIENAIDILNMINIKYKLSLKIIFKVHPLDRYRKNYHRVFHQYASPNVIFTFDDETDALIKGAKFIFTINSTVGFTSISRNKIVVVFGNALYLIKAVSISCYDFVYMLNNIDEFQEFYLAVDNNLSKRKAFTDFIVNCYLVDANINRLNKKDIENLINAVIF